MKKRLMTAMVAGLPLMALAATTQPTLNQNTIKTMMQLQQKQLYLQQQMQRLQVSLVEMQKQQLKLQHSLLAQADSPTAKGFKWLTMAAGSMAIPTNRINAGLADGAKVYICHAKYGDLGVHPGTLTDKGCLISYGGRAYTEASYQVLTGTGKVIWKSGSSLYQLNRPLMPFGGLGPVIPLGSGLKIKNAFKPASQSLPIIGGYAKGQNIYICRTIVANHIHVGKVVAGNCNVGYEGNELVQKSFQVLFSN